MDINNMNETQVKQELKKLIRSSYRKMETLRKRGYEDYQWNKDYRGFMQKKFGVKTGKAMIKRVDDLNFNQARGILAYNQRHLRGYESSITGVRKMEKESLELIARLKGEDDWTIRRNRKDQYIFSTPDEKRVITRDELSKFWKVVHNVSGPDNKLALSFKGGSEEGVATVYDYFFKQNMNTGEIFDMVEKKYNELREEEERRREAMEAELERIRSKKKFSNR